MRFFVLFVIAVLGFSQDIILEKVNGSIGYINKSIQKGRSGYVICPFDKKEIICAKVIFFGNKVKFENYDELKNNAFALPVVTPKAKDKIILNNYKRILIIAPTQELYLKIKDMYKNKTVIHPDLLYVYLDGEISKEGLEEFAKIMNIDEYIFVLDKIYEVDANSFYAIKTFSKVNIHYKFIFYNSYKKGKTSKNMIKEYKSFIKD